MDDALGRENGCMADGCMIMCACMCMVPTHTTRARLTIVVVGKAEVKESDTRVLLRVVYGFTLECTVPRRLRRCGVVIVRAS